MRRLSALLLIVAFLINSCAPGFITIQPTATEAPTATPLPTPIARTPVPSATALPDLGIQPDKLKGVEVVVWHGWDGTSTSLLNQMAGEFSLSNKWGIKVTTVSQQNLSLLSEAVDKSLTTTEHPDIVVALPEQILAWKEQVIDLTPYTVQTDTGFDPKDFLSTFGDQSFVDGVRYGVPAARTARFLFYNTSFAKDLGFTTPPQTMDEFSKQACAANAFWKQDKDLTNDGYGGLALDVESNWQTPYSWLVTNGGKVTTGGVVQFNSPDNVQALDAVSKLRANNCAWLPDGLSNYEYLADRRALFITGGLEEIANENLAFSTASSADQWTVLPFPGTDTGIVAYGPDYAILKSTSARQLGAWLFIRWMLQPDNQARWSHGSGLLPVTGPALSLIKADQAAPQQYSAALDLIPVAKGYPQSATWRQDDKILADGFIAYFRMYPSMSLADMLGQMDAIVKDLTKK